MTIFEYLERDPALANVPKLDPVFDIVQNQINRNTRRGFYNDDARPNEPQTSRDWRERNRRLIFKDGATKYKTKLSRILSISGLTVNATKEQKDLYSKVVGKDFVSWLAYDYLENSIDFPNNIQFIFPFTKNGNGNPELNHDKRYSVLKKVIELEVKDILYKDESLLIFTLHNYDPETGMKIYYSVDEMNMYVLNPTKEETIITDQFGKNQREIVTRYKPQLWYVHETETLLHIGHLGLNSISKDNTPYKESLLQPLFEYTDEAMNSFSDNQAVVTQHAFPKMIIDELVCPAKGCNAGTISVEGGNDGMSAITCNVCGGSGRLTNIEPFSILIRDKDSTRDGITHVAPDPAILNITYDRSFDLFDKGCKAIGINVLGTEQESGKAKEYRLEDIQDQLKYICLQLKMNIDLFMYIVEHLDTSKVPDNPGTIMVPDSFKIKDAFDLRSDYENAPLSDKINSFIQFIEKKYHGDEATIKAYKKAVEINHIIVYQLNEIQSLAALGLEIADYMASIRGLKNLLLLKEEIIAMDDAQILSAYGRE